MFKSSTAAAAAASTGLVWPVRSFLPYINITWDQTRHLDFLGQRRRHRHDMRCLEWLWRWHRRHGPARRGRTRTGTHGMDQLWHRQAAAAASLVLKCRAAAVSWMIRPASYLRTGARANVHKALRWGNWRRAHEFDLHLSLPRRLWAGSVRKWAVLRGRHVGSGTTARRRKAFPTLSYLKSGLSRGSSRRLSDHSGDFSLAALSTTCGGSVAQPSASLALTKWSLSGTWHRHHLFIRARFPLQAERRRLARPMLMSESRSLSLLSCDRHSPLSTLLAPSFAHTLTPGNLRPNCRSRALSLLGSSFPAHFVRRVCVLPGRALRRSWPARRRPGGVRRRGLGAMGNRASIHEVSENVNHESGKCSACFMKATSKLHLPHGPRVLYVCGRTPSCMSVCTRWQWRNYKQTSSLAIETIDLFHPERENRFPDLVRIITNKLCIC